MEDFNEIVPHLFISNWDTSNNINFIQEKNIKAVITLEMSLKPAEIVRYYKMHNIDFIHIRINDSENEDISKYFEDTFDFIREHLNKGENVLVHCAAGISRSATIIIHYIIRTFFENNDLRNLDSMDILNYIVGRVRTIRLVNPNRGFSNQLLSVIDSYKTMYV